jgi:16S rRNA (adenine1518-N6/adenine1519-N6)-dimethyltransferase
VKPEEVSAFRRFVTACFGFRRKQLRGVVRGVTGADAAAVDAGLRSLGLDPRVRPETLPPEQFLRLLRHPW